MTRASHLGLSRGADEEGYNNDDKDRAAGAALEAGKPSSPVFSSSHGEQRTDGTAGMLMEEPPADCGRSNAMQHMATGNMLRTDHRENFPPTPPPVRLDASSHGTFSLFAAILQFVVDFCCKPPRHLFSGFCTRILSSALHLRTRICYSPMLSTVQSWRRTKILDQVNAVRPEADDHERRCSTSDPRRRSTTTVGSYLQPSSSSFECVISACIQQPVQARPSSVRAA